MSRFEATFRSAVANAERDVMIEQIRSTPQMSLAELGKLATGELGSLLKGITIGEILGQATSKPARPSAGKAARPAAAAAPAKSSGGRKSSRPAAGKGKAKGKAKDKDSGEKESAPAKRGGGGSKSVDTRTPAGREAYDQAVLEALKAAGKAAAAPDLSTVAGGTPLQVRTALARLIERGLATWSGQARGTRYTAA